jgi:hypothetical protein
MNTKGFFVVLFAALAVANSHAAPGEDPVLLTKQVSVNMLPLGATAAKSTGMDPTADMPAWLKARVARYESKAYATGAAADNVLTNNDVITTANAQGVQKACVQEVGSTTTASSTGFNQYGPKGQAQVVVLKGDLVNICR